MRFAQEGYAFYALDLRKHGRSLAAHQHPCFCKDLSEYFADLTRALEEIGEPVLLAGIRPAGCCARSTRTKASGATRCARSGSTAHSSIST
jgi:alpha-beta hydrolase superfamily lysophospholipase